MIMPRGHIFVLHIQYYCLLKRFVVTYTPGALATKPDIQTSGHPVLPCTFCLRRSPFKTSSTTGCFPGFADGFLKRFGSLGSEWKWKLPLDHRVPSGGGDGGHPRRSSLRGAAAETAARPMKQSASEKLGPGRPSGKLMALVNDKNQMQTSALYFSHKRT